MTLIQALADRDLLGGLPSFRRLESWARWLIFLAAIYGLPLATNEQEDLFGHHTGRSKYAPPPGGYPEAAVITGRQSGKTQIAGLIVEHEAQQPQPESDGVERFALGVGQDQRASIRTLFAYMTAPYRLVPALRHLMAAEPTQDTLRLTNGVTLAAYPCRPAALRGVRAVVVALDELGFYLNSEGNPVGTEMLRAARPCLATTGGKLIVLSSPYAAEGALYDLHRQHFGKDESATLIWQATAPEMNPTLPQDYLRRMQEDDPEAYRSEVLGEFRTGTSALFDPEAIEACVDRGIRERLSA